jgi:hypothetical protein
MRTTKKEKIERFDGLMRERNTLQIALKLALTTQPDGAVSYSEADDGSTTVVTVTLYGATRANGGIVVVRHSFDGIPSSRDGIDAFDFEDWYRYADGLPFYGAHWIVKLKECANQLRLRRNDLLGIERGMGV